MNSGKNEEAEKSYRAILDALEELSLLNQDVADQPETEGVRRDDEDDERDDVDLVAMMAEESAERGLNEEASERVFKAVAAFEKVVREG